MEAAHLGSGNRICSVVFADIVQSSEESVSRQVEMKAAFGEILATALEHTPAADRIVLDTGDGAALCFLGDPEDALFAANSLRSGVIELPEQHGLRLRLGINLGPVRVVSDINGHSNVIGDGINVAQRVMSFAEPNQILVSRSYYEVVSRLAPDYAQLFQYVGSHRDKHVREHEVYEVHLAPPLGRVAAGPIDNGPAPTADSPIHAPAVVERTVALDPAFIERLASALAREIGPVAKLIVRRAAEHAAGEGALLDAVAEHVPAASRASFLARRSDLLGAPRAAAGSPPVPATAAPDQPGPQARQATGLVQKIGPEVLARVEKMLTARIGPVARILVRRAVAQAASPRDLFEALAVHIDDPEVRKVFLAEAERL
jgi:class 3 adenylate cyclase